MKHKNLCFLDRLLRGKEKPITISYHSRLLSFQHGEKTNSDFVPAFNIYSLKFISSLASPDHAQDFFLRVHFL